MLARAFCLLLVVGVASALAVPAIPKVRKCIPLQYESAVYGKLAEMVEGKGIVGEIYGTTSIDNYEHRAALRESVFRDGEFQGNYTLLFTNVCTYPQPWYNLLVVGLQKF